MNGEIYDPRKVLVNKLHEAGVDFNKSFFIALDAGRSLVNKQYLKDFGLRKEQLIAAGNIIKEFYWDNENVD